MNAPIRSFLRSHARRTRTRRATIITLTLFLLVLAAAYTALGDPALFVAGRGFGMYMNPPELFWSRPLADAVPPWAGMGGEDAGGVPWGEGSGEGNGGWMVGTGPRGVAAARHGKGIAQAVWFDGAGFVTGRWTGEAHNAAVAGTTVLAALTSHGAMELVALTPGVLPSGHQLLTRQGGAGFLFPFSGGGAAVVAGGSVSPGAGGAAPGGAEFGGAHDPVWEEQVLLLRDEGGGSFGHAASITLTDEPVLAAAPGAAPPAAGGAALHLQPPIVQGFLSRPGAPWEPAVALLTVRPGEGVAAVPWSITILKSGRGGPEAVFSDEGMPWRPWATSRGRGVWASQGDSIALLEGGRIQWQETLPDQVLSVLSVDGRGDRAVVHYEGGWSLFDRGGVVVGRGEDSSTATARLWPGPGWGFFEETDGKLQWYDQRGTPRWALPLAEPLAALAAHGDTVVFIDSRGVHRYGWR